MPNTWWVSLPSSGLTSTCECLSKRGVSVASSWPPGSTTRHGCIGASQSYSHTSSRPSLLSRPSTIRPFSVKPVPAVHFAPTCSPMVCPANRPAPPPQFQLIRAGHRPRPTSRTPHASAPLGAADHPAPIPDHELTRRGPSLVLRREVEPLVAPRDHHVERLVSGRELDGHVEPSLATVGLGPRCREVRTGLVVGDAQLQPVAVDDERRRTGELRELDVCGVHHDGASAGFRRARGRPSTRRPARTGRRRSTPTRRRSRPPGRPSSPIACSHRSSRRGWRGAAGAATSPARPG